MKKIINIIAITAIVAICSCSKENVQPSNTETQVQSIPSGIDSATLSIARRLTVALNAGNAQAATEAFAPQATFNSIGRIYNGRNEIMNRFLIPEVININGKYTEVRITPSIANSNIITIDYRFGNGSFTERFTYEYTIENGVIVFVMGRYI